MCVDVCAKRVCIAASRERLSQGVNKFLYQTNPGYMDVFLSNCFPSVAKHLHLALILIK